MTKELAAFAFFPLLLAALPAQKMPLAAGERVVALLAIDKILPLADGANVGPDLPRHLAALLRAAAARDGTGADVQALGGDHVAALGTPPQVAAVEAVAAALRRSEQPQLFLDCKLWEVDAATFDNVLGEHTTNSGDATQESRTGVLAAASLDPTFRQLKAGRHCEVLQMPKVVALGLQTAVLQTGVQVPAGVGGATMFDGHRVEAVCAQVGEGRIAAHVEVAMQRRSRPAANGAADDDGADTQPVARCGTGHAAVVEPGGAIVQAVRLGADRWFVAFVGIQPIRSAVAMPARR